jgi:hypothetical protein
MHGWGKNKQRSLITEYLASNIIQLGRNNFKEHACRNKYVKMKLFNAFLEDTLLKSSSCLEN